MSWDVIFTSPNGAMGPKDNVRESFLKACEGITGQEISRRGPTEVEIDTSFSYEALFIGHKRAIESLTLAFHIMHGDPQTEPNHPVHSFIRQIIANTGWQATDTVSGSAITYGG